LKIRYLLLILSALIAVIGFVQPAFAQTTNGISGFHNVTLWLYPEYDDPRLLVMMEGKVAANEVPSTVRFLVPQIAEMYSAGSKDAQGNYSGGPPNRIASQIPGWDEINYQLKTDTFRVEYYDDIITGTVDKKISFDFRWLYPITDLTVVVQQPLKASNFAVNPAGKQSIEGQFSVNNFNFSNPDINQPLHFDVTYTKTDPNPSLGNSPASSSSKITTGQLTLIVVAVLVMVGLIVFFTVYKLKKKKPEKARRTQKRARAITASLKERVCDQCGSTVGKGSEYCPHCGNEMDP
jgi:hypothetical protein